MQYPFKTKPYKHQVLGMRHCFKQFREGHGAALLFDPRTGKSKTAVDVAAALHLKAGVRRVLIIAPNRVLGTWVEEFHTHCPLIAQTIVWDKDARKKPLPRYMGPYDLQVVIVNFEAFATPGRRTPSGRRSKASGRFKHRTMIRQWLGGEPALCIVDEGHKLKSPSGKASNAIVSMRSDFMFRLLLTGTPITKAHRAHDIYMLWQWVNPERFQSWGPTVERFKDHVGRWTQRNGFPQWLGPNDRGMRDLQRGLHKDGMVVKRSDCFDLPPVDVRIIPVRLKEAARAYQDMAETFVHELEEGLVAEADIPLVVTLRLLQITGGHVGIRSPHPHNPDKMISTAHVVGKEKLHALQDLLIEETLEREEKVVIAAKFKAELDAIIALCERLEIDVETIRGGMARDRTDAAIRAFRKPTDRATAMVIQPDAASLGIDLSTASQMIWYSLTPSWVNWTQACDRIALSRTSTTFTYLQVPHSVDSLLYQSLLNDTDVSRMILKNPRGILLR
jgi:SNF2 family DNA or RNA helicase